MSHSITVRKTYKYRLYRCDQRDLHLPHQINVTGRIWNHALALQKRYHRLMGKYSPLDAMQHHIARLRMRTLRFAHWKALGSQAVKEVLQRLARGYCSVENIVNR